MTSLSTFLVCLKSNDTNISNGGSAYKADVPIMIYNDCKLPLKKSLENVDLSLVWIIIISDIRDSWSQEKRLV